MHILKLQIAGIPLELQLPAAWKPYADAWLQDGDGPMLRLQSRPMQVKVHGNARGVPKLSAAEYKAVLLDGGAFYQAHYFPEIQSAEVWLNPAYVHDGLAHLLRQLSMRGVFARRGWVAHAAAVEWGDGAMIFYGPSGAGKSTLCRLAQKRRVLSDDLVALRRVKGAWHCWGLPVFNRLQRRPHLYAESRGIRGVFRLQQAPRAALEPLSRAQATATLLAVPAWSPAECGIPGLMTEVGDLLNAVPCYTLHFPKDPSFWDVIGAQFESEAA